MNNDTGIPVSDIREITLSRIWSFLMSTGLDRIWNVHDECTRVTSSFARECLGFLRTYSSWQATTDSDSSLKVKIDPAYQYALETHLYGYKAGSGKFHGAEILAVIRVEMGGRPDLPKPDILLE